MHILLDESLPRPLARLLPGHEACSPSLRHRITGHTFTPLSGRGRHLAIDAIELIGGNLPRRQWRLVEAWAEIHQRELLDDWERLQAGRLPLKIEPLR